MNRRDALKASLGGLIPGVATAEVIHEAKHEFRPMDKRLDFKVSPTDLNDGEYGYVNSSYLITATMDSPCLFWNPDSSWNLCCASDESKQQIIDSTLGVAQPVWVGRKGDFLHIELPEAVIQERYGILKLPDVKEWLPRRAILAYNQAYPLTEKTEGRYIVPISFENKCRNETFRNNQEKLIEVIILYAQLQDDYGIFTSFKSGDYLQNRVRAALGLPLKEHANGLLPPFHWNEILSEFNDLRS